MASVSRFHDLFSFSKKNPKTWNALGRKDNSICVRALEASGKCLLQPCFQSSGATDHTWTVNWEACSSCHSAECTSFCLQICSNSHSFILQRSCWTRGFGPTWNWIPRTYFKKSSRHWKCSQTAEPIFVTIHMKNWPTHSKTGRICQAAATSNTSKG